jgi:hypothetical protein
MGTIDLRMLEESFVENFDKFVEFLGVLGEELALLAEVGVLALARRVKVWMNVKQGESLHNFAKRHEHQRRTRVADVATYD